MLFYFRGNSVVAGICLPEGTTVEDLKLYSNRPPGVSTSTDGFTRVDTIDEVFADQTMTRIFVDGRYQWIIGSCAEPEGNRGSEPVTENQKWIYVSLEICKRTTLKKQLDP